MRRIYNETGALTPAEKLSNWVFDRLWRLFFVVLFAILFYFMVGWFIDFANFVQSGGELGSKYYDPSPNILLAIRAVGTLIIGFLILLKRL